MTRMFDIREPSIEALRAAPVYFRYGSNKKRVLVDGSTARAILICYDAIGTVELKEKFERLVCKDQRTLLQIINFCWKQVSFK
jgi:hypothetical protein